MAAPVQTALIGDDVQVETDAVRAESTNDLDEITSVLVLAQEPGFMLGPTGQVARKLDGRVIELVDSTQAAAVHQLIRSRQLRVGGHHTVQLAGHSVSARSVLVPPPTRALICRWRAYRSLR